jgi:CheY-like chemotaxis protein
LEGGATLKTDVTVLIVEDDDAHATLIERNLRRAGISNTMIRFRDGQEVLDFLFRRSSPCRALDAAYLMLLDIKMPKVDGVEVLRQLRQDPELRKLPVVMLTTTDDPNEVERCHALGCSCYVAKPVEYTQFVEAIRRLGLFLLIVQVPRLNGLAPKPATG